MFYIFNSIENKSILKLCKLSNQYLLIYIIYVIVFNLIDPIPVYINLYNIYINTITTIIYRSIFISLFFLSKELHIFLL